MPSENKTERYPLDLAACHGRMDALRYALRKADEALITAMPYVNGPRADPSVSPWRQETANESFETVRAARDLIARELNCDD